MLMNRIVYAVFAFMTCFTSYAQKLNGRGQKIVSSVHIEKYFFNGGIEETTDVIYNYDSNYELTGMTRIITVENETCKDIIQKQKDGNFKRVTYYNGRIDKQCHYEYEVNDYGQIEAKKAKYVIGSDSVMKITNYEYYGEEDSLRLKQIKRRQYVKDGREWSAAHDEYYLNFDYWDGDCYWAEGYSSTFNVKGERQYYGGEVKYKENQYGKIKNDTNINPNLFISMACWEICLDSHEFELSSKWCGMKSDYIMDYVHGRKIYSIVDSNGNLVELLRKNIKGNPYVKVTIKYQM